MGRSETAAKVGIALKDMIGEKVGVDVAKEPAQLDMEGYKVREPFDVFHHLSIGQDAGGSLMLSQPGGNKIYYRVASLQIGPKRAGVQQVAPHSSMGGVGLLSCLMRSRASTMSFQSR